MTDIEIAKGTIDGHSVCFCKKTRGMVYESLLRFGVILIQ